MREKNFKERFEQLLKDYKISLAQLHKNTGVPLTTLKRIRNDLSANPTLSSLAPVAEFFSITINQLVGIDPLPNDLPVGVYVEKRDQWTLVPMISWSQVLDWPNNRSLLVDAELISTDIELSDAAYALEVLEDGWMGFLKNTKLIIDPAVEPKNKSYAVVHKKGEITASFKHVLMHDGVIYLKPPDPDFEKAVFDENLYEFKGVMLQARMDV